MSKGRSLRLFLADGTPGGIITAEIMNWTGHVLWAPRSRLADLIRRPEAARTGIYFLTGTDPGGAPVPRVYIGETDTIAKRLAQHNKDEAKDFWDHVCIVTSKDQNLTKAHARYLESRLIQIATEAGRAILANGTNPDYALLPEADISDMEYFIEQVQVVLPVLGLEFLRNRPALALVTAVSNVGTGGAPTASACFELLSRRHGMEAEAEEIDGQFIVRVGSQARERWVGKEGYGNGYRALYHQLAEQGILCPDDAGHLRFTQDYAFTSPSAAATVINGRNANGRTEWLVQGSAKTYAQWQEEQVAAVTPVDAGGEE